MPFILTSKVGNLTWKRNPNLKQSISRYYQDYRNLFFTYQKISKIIKKYQSVSKRFLVLVITEHHKKA
jgi:hypothetical protein